MIDFEKRRLAQLLEPSRGQHADAQRRWLSFGGKLIRPEDGPSAASLRRTEDLIVLQLLKGRADGVPTDLEQIRKPSFAWQPVRPFASGKAETDHPLTLDDETSSRWHWLVSHFDEPFVPIG